MGKYEAMRPPLAKRLVLRLDDALAQRGLHRPRLPRPSKAKSFPVIAFFMVMSFTLVYVVDPYSGSLASAATIQTIGSSSEQDDQSFVYQEEYTVSFERGGFKVVSGSEARTFFVLAADMPQPGTPKFYAMNYIAERGWEFDQFSCLVNLWTRESNWRPLAKNSSSGAYGIPQALPGTKMATEGPDWMTNPETQIRWGVKYIAARYKTPCGAWAFFTENNWY
ncbi:MAG: lytic transglycosylase domain-containing protein [Actinomycetota bacterium]